jgi:hypothetical protein
MLNMSTLYMGEFLQLCQLSSTSSRISIGRSLFGCEAMLGQWRVLRWQQMVPWEVDIRQFFLRFTGFLVG